MIYVRLIFFYPELIINPKDNRIVYQAKFHSCHYPIGIIGSKVVLTEVDQRRDG